MKKSYLIIILFAIIAVSLFNVLFDLFSNGERKDATITDESFQHVEIDTENAKINVKVTEDKPFVELINSDLYDLNVEIEGNTLDIEVERKWFRWFSFDLFSSSPVLNVFLPEHLYETLKIDTNNGGVNVSNFEVNEMSVNTNNGKIIMNNIKSSYIYAESNNGNVNLNNVNGKVISETNNGDVTISTNALSSPFSIGTDNGDIIIETIKEPENTTLDIKTHNGEINVFGSNSYNSVIGNGHNLIKLNSHNGNITIKTQ
nr:DUF4097 family beta strand repeat-containing protein [Lysinibacillus timonensis]